MKKNSIFVDILAFFAIVVVFAFLFNEFAQSTEPQDQRTHWQLVSGLRNTTTDEVGSVRPASSHDFTKDECVKTAKLLIQLFDLLHSPDGKYTIAFGCVPLDLTDIKLKKVAP